MDFLFAGLDTDPKQDPYDVLSELCTLLVVSEEGLVPLEPVTDVVLRTMRRRPADGDVQVMAARVVGVLLDKFSPSFRIFTRRRGTSSVTECLQGVYALVSDKGVTTAQTFAKTTAAELVEELLKCLTLGSSSIPAIRAILPSTDVQLQFCRAVLNGSTWTTCKVLRHCCLLVRCGQLAGGTQQATMRAIIRQELNLLERLNIDFEWDELLRAVTETVVTLRVWGGDPSRADTASVPTPNRANKDAVPSRQDRKRRRQDHTSSVSSMATSDKTSGTGTTTDKSAEEFFVDLCQRVCRSDAMATGRKELVLACAGAALRSSEVHCRVPAEARCRFVKLLLSVLEASARTSLTLSNPFSRKGVVSTDAEEEDGFKLLPNLQWEVPSMHWSALMLLCTLLGATAETDADYVWAWRGEDDLWYWYDKRERPKMTAAFFSGRREVLLKEAEHKVDLVSMTDTHRNTGMVARMHFQPVPAHHSLHDGPLVQGDNAEMLLHMYGELMAAVRVVLRAASFGGTPSAQLAKLLSLHCVCVTGPDHGDDTRATLQQLVAALTPTSLEAMAARLMQRNAAWAPVLCDAGVDDVLARTPSVVTAPVGVIGSAATASKRRRTERGPAAVGVHHDAPRTGESPVARMLRHAVASGTAAQHSGCQPSKSDPLFGSPPPLNELQLPPTTAAALVRQLADASLTETVALLARLATDVTVSASTAAVATDVTAAVREWLSSDLAARKRVESALTAAVVRELQHLSVATRRETLEDALEQDAMLNIAVCDPEQANDDGSTDTKGVADDVRCPNGHRLQVHFSVNWRCDRCKQYTVCGSLACRVCNYDLCRDCLQDLSKKLEVNPTACADDVLRVWLRRHHRHQQQRGKRSGEPRAARHVQGSERAAGERKGDSRSGGAHNGFYTLFSSLGVVPGPFPAKLLSLGRLHCGQPYGECLCGTCTCSTGIHSASTRRQALPPSLTALLNVCGEHVAADTAVMYALIDAVESHGTRIFLNGGVEGLTPSLRLLLTALAPHLGLSFRADLTRFLAVDCRRFALFHLQEDSGLLLRGTVQGEIGSNGLTHRVDVVRDDYETTVMRLHTAFAARPSLRNKVEFHFDGEEGTGNGPTQELYTELSHWFRSQTKLWHALEDSGSTGFPSCKALFLPHFFVLGALFGRAFIDGYSMDMGLLPCLWGLVRRGGRPVQSREALSVLLQELDATYARSLQTLLNSSNAELEAMGLFDSDGATLSTETAHAYVERCTADYLDVGLENARAMALGLALSIDPSTLFLLSEGELSIVLGGHPHGTADATEDEQSRIFSEADLRSVLVPAHGYSAESKEVDCFAKIVGSELSRQQQIFFLEFLTGSARLPLNGLAGLARKITVVKKEMEDESKQQTLPSCNTCFLYFKLPPYTTHDIMRDRLIVAITEGRKNFSLS